MYGLKYWIHFVLFAVSLYSICVLLFQIHLLKTYKSLRNHIFTISWYEKYLISIIGVMQLVQ